MENIDKIYELLDSIEVTKENSIEIWKDIYLNEITPCVKTALQEGFHSAYEKYSDMTQKLLNKYLPDQDGGKKDEL